MSKTPASPKPRRSLRIANRDREDENDDDDEDSSSTSSTPSPPPPPPPRGHRHRSKKKKKKKKKKKSVSASDGSATREDQPEPPETDGFSVNQLLEMSRQARKDHGFPYAEPETDEMTKAASGGWKQRCARCCHYKKNTEFRRKSKTSGRWTHFCPEGDAARVHSLVDCPTHHFAGEMHRVEFQKWKQGRSRGFSRRNRQAMATYARTGIPELHQMKKQHRNSKNAKKLRESLLGKRPRPSSQEDEEGEEQERDEMGASACGGVSPCPVQRKRRRLSAESENQLREGVVRFSKLISVSRTEPGTILSARLQFLKNSNDSQIVTTVSTILPVPDPAFDGFVQKQVASVGDEGSEFDFQQEGSEFLGRLAVRLVKGQE